MKDSISHLYIILPVYNGEKYFLEQLISIYHQNYKNWFLIIVNDGSTDSSEKIARKFISDYNLKDKVKIINKENGGLNSAITRGFEEIKKMCDIYSCESLVAYCDCDDVWTRDKLALQVKYMQDHPECGLSYHDLAKIDENDILQNHSILHGKYKEDKSFLKISTMGARMIATEMMFRVRYIDVILPMPLGKEMPQDYRTALILSLLQVKIGYIDKVLAYYRVHHTSMQTVIEKDFKKVSDRYINILKFLQERFPNKDFTTIISYNEDTRYKWIKKKYNIFTRSILRLFKYPKIFFIGLKEFIYEVILIKFK